jgi:hypothetical protein
MTKPRSPNGVTLTYPATTAYKQWVWKTIRKRWPKPQGALQALVNELKSKARAELMAIGKHETISTATLSDLLGPEDEIPRDSNSALLPALNKVLGLAPPPVCDPTEELSQLVDRFRARWAEATPRERDALIALLARRDDESGLDGDRDAARSASPAARRTRRDLDH